MIVAGNRNETCKIKQNTGGKRMETEKIISYFKEISSIPRQSGDEKAVSDYLTAFAKELGRVLLPI